LRYENAISRLRVVFKRHLATYGHTVGDITC